MSGELIQLNVVGVEGKKIPVVLNQNLTIKELFEQVSSKCGLTVSADDLRLIYQGQELDCKSNTSLFDYGFEHNGHLYMVVRVKGGQSIKG